MWWENLFAAFWILLQFIFWVAVILIALAVLGMLAIGLWRALLRALPSKRYDEHPDRQP